MESAAKFEVLLPNDDIECLEIASDKTVYNLKLICEEHFGVPVELQAIYLVDNDDVELQDWACLKDAATHTFKLQVPICWLKLLTGILNNEIEHVFRRVQFPMQQISREERLFVSLFMSCCRGNSEMSKRLLDLDILVDLKTATNSKRTLLHACALSGDIKSLEMIFKHLMSSSIDCISALDVNRESAMDIAKRLGKEDLAKRLIEYLFVEDEEKRIGRGSFESGIGLSDDENNEAMPHQAQTNTACNINTSVSSNERGVTKVKQNGPRKENDSLGDKDHSKDLLSNGVLTLGRDDIGKSVESIPAENTSCGESHVIGSSNDQITPRSSSSFSSLSVEVDKVSSSYPIRPTSLSVKPLLGRRREISEEPITGRRRVGRIHVPNINVYDESSDEEDRLPQLEETRCVVGHKSLQRSRSTGSNTQAPWKIERHHFRSISPPNSPVTTPRQSPTSENPNLEIKEERDVFDTRSAPTSPQVSRSQIPGNITRARSPAPPNSASFRAQSRRQSEPFAPARINGGSNGVRFTRLRKGSVMLPQSPEFASIPGQRVKSKSICESNISDSVRSHLLSRSMDSGQRLEKPWNAWLAAKRGETSATLAPTPEESLKVPASPGGRKRSFQQWLNEKDMDEMRRLHEESQIEAQKVAHRSGKQIKGKSFEDWLEDKHRESQREKEKEKEKEDEHKGKVEMKQQRRRMSQAKYQSWLQDKELQALEEEEKRLGQAKEQLEKMRRKWEEQDELKKQQTSSSKRSVIRTQSCPTNKQHDISRQRFSSLQASK
ncbi:uncharacterized protein LOC5510835 [Nematostella vectensis]|nr:uncharacterized protein LOC5510835 [Nematostella vectensis]